MPGVDENTDKIEDNEENKIEAEKIDGENTVNNEIEEENMARTIIGHIEPYILGDDFSYYKLRLEHFLSLNKITEDAEKREVLAVFGGQDLFRVLYSLIQPAKIEDKTFAELIKALDDHFKPKRNEVAESFKFNTTNQKQGETLAEYIVVLKSMAQLCNFGDFLDRALRDRFICGISNESIQRKLFNDSTVTTFQKACDIALTMETTRNNLEVIHNNAVGESVNLVQHDNKRASYGRHSNGHSNNNNYSSSSHKGYSNNNNSSNFGKSHSGQSKGNECYSCGRTGHIARNCFKNRGNFHGKSNYSDKEQVNLKHFTDDDFENCDFTFENQYLNTLNSNFIHTVKSGALTTLVNINGREVRMEIDTGACGTVMPERQFVEFFAGLILRPPNRGFSLLSGESVSIVGCSDVCVRHNKRSHQLVLHVIKASANVLPLMGQDWLDNLYPGWREFFKNFNENNMMPSNQVHNVLNFNIAAYQKQLKSKFSHVFSNNMFLPVKNFEAEIILNENAQPIFCKPYSVPFGARDAVKKELDRLVENGILIPVKHSKQATPIVIVMKPNGDVRICVDCKRTLNRFIETEHYPLPIIDDIFANLSDAKVFCVLDLTGAYQQLAVSERSQELLTINTHKGLYKYTRLAYGVASAPAIFQSFMDETLKDLPNVKCYFDDVCIGGKDFKEAQHNLELVLQRFEDNNIRVNLSKCKFFQTTIEYLGHVISDGSLRPNDKKVEAVLKAVPPRNVNQLQSFIGMVNYYAKFISNLSSELHPLYKLLKKGTHFEWNDEQNEAFEKCKRLLASNNVLALYDPTKEIIISCDASPYGIGCVLSQIFDKVEKPVLFASSSLSPAEKNYSQVHREALAVVFSVKKFHKYIYGKEFTIRSDCQALREIFSSKNVPPVAAARLQRWSVFLSMYRYKMEYKSAFNMRNADGLSRLPLQSNTEIEGSSINMLKLNAEMHLPISVDTVRQYTMDDEYLRRICDYVHSGWPDKVPDNLKHYFLKKNSIASEDGCLFYHERILIPFKLRKQVLELLHESHVGIVRSKALARSYVWWPGIDVDIENWSKCCKACQSMQNKKSEKELSSWPATTKPFERVHIDFYEFGKNKFLILVDDYSKWLEVIPMGSTIASITIDKLKFVFATFGLPTEIVSDNGPPFNSFEFKNFCDRNGIRSTHSPPRHAQSNGEAEVSVRDAKQALKKMLIDERSKNIPILSRVTNFLLKHRLTPTTVTGNSPASMIFNFKPKSLLDIINDKPIKHSTGIARTNSPPTRPLKNQLSDDRSKNERKITSYKNNEIVSYQIQWNNFIKWVPAKIIRKISNSVYVVLVNGSSKTAHLRQLRKTKANNLSDWPGTFEHNNIESNCNVDIENDNNNNNNTDVNNVSRKRLRSPSPVESGDSEVENEENELKRSSRLENVPRPNYRETRIIKRRKKERLI